MAMLGVPYGDAVNTGAQLAKDQAARVASGLQQQGGPVGLQDKEMVALIAYIQRLGQDIKGAPVAATGTNATAGVATAPGARP
jgi:cytochrome c oxidase cbb3-type subunit I/II